MSVYPLRRIATAVLAVPLALALAACGSKQDEGAAPNGAPIEKIAPPAGKAWADVIARTEEGGYVMGNPKAPIKVVEYGSLTCSHCAEFAEKSEPDLRDGFVASGRVSYEFRNFVRDPIDITAAQLIRCGAPESFFALTQQVFANQPAIIQKAQAAGEAAFQAAINQPENKRGMALAEMTGLIDFFAARGIAREQAATCLADGNVAKTLAQATEQQGDKYSIEGTPTFLINGQKADLNTWEALKARLETLGAR